MTDAAYVRLAGLLGMIALGAILYRLPIWPSLPGPQASGTAVAQQPSARESPNASATFAAQTLAQLVTLVLIPVLLFRTMARLDLQQMPWEAAQAYFAPVLVCLVIVNLVFYARAAPAASGEAAPAAPAARTTAALYGNAVQLGIPIAGSLFGAEGLAIHLALVSLHSLLVLTTLTVSAEWSIARSKRQTSGKTAADHALETVKQAVIRSVWHPVVLPIVLGLLWNLTGNALPRWLDDGLAVLGAAAVPLCLILIGMNLAQFGLKTSAASAMPQMVIKLLVLPAVVFVVANKLLGIQGQTLAVLVMMAALPVGTNALIFAQRYKVLQAEATTAIVLSTFAFVLTAPAWLWMLQRWA